MLVDIWLERRTTQEKSVNAFYLWDIVGVCHVEKACSATPTVHDKQKRNDESNNNNNGAQSIKNHLQFWISRKVYILFVAHAPLERRPESTYYICDISNVVRYQITQCTRRAPANLLLFHFDVARYHLFYLSFSLSSRRSFREQRSCCRWQWHALTKIYFLVHQKWIHFEITRTNSMGVCEILGEHLVSLLIFSLADAHAMMPCNVTYEE